MFEETNTEIDKESKPSFTSYDQDLPQRDLAVEFGLYEDDQSWREKLNNDPVERFKNILAEHDKIENEQKKYDSNFVKLEDVPAPSSDLKKYRTATPTTEKEYQGKSNNIPYRLVEIPSLSAQGTKSISELLDSKILTQTMLGNLEKIRENIPSENVGISLHTGMLVDLDMVKKSRLPVTSIDTPDTTWLMERLMTIIKRPAQTPEHIGWALNSSFGLTRSNAEANLENSFEKAKELEPFNSSPFVRLSVEPTTHFESLLKSLSQKFPDVTIALEYNAEKMSLDQYLDLVRKLRAGNPNIGISWDPAHAYEREYIDRLTTQNPNSASSQALEHIQNVFTNLTNQDKIYILSIDYNNVPKQIHGYGETHKSVLEQGGAVSNKWLTEQYSKYLRRYNLSGRMVFPEVSPTQSSLLVTKEGLAYALSQVQSFISIHQ